jgi:2,4-dienoyl-CoA reductase-like NADH-dependent reductase (Old Yellow Enzyme family)
MATPEGACTPALVDLMSGLARGGVGLIITSYAYVRTDGQCSVGQLGIYKDDLIEGFRHMTKAVHDLGGRIVFQIAHGGFYADPKLTEQVLLAPSRIEDVRKSAHREMTLEDIRGVVESFGHAACRAKEAGFDGVQIHAAHGYLLAQFLSPAFNKREDDYGGPLENRARALLEVLRRLKTEVGNDFPILVKMNSEDFVEGGLTLEDAVKVGAMLQEGGIDAIELSGGTLFPENSVPFEKGSNPKRMRPILKIQQKPLKRPFRPRCFWWEGFVPFKWPKNSLVKGQPITSP